MNNEEVQNKIKLPIFVGIIMLIWVIFLLVATPQWMLICLYAKNHLVYMLTFLFSGFILLVCLHMCESLKYWRPWNVVYTVFCYELLVIGSSLFLTYWTLVESIIVMSVALLFSILCMLVSLLLILNDKYLNPIKTAVIGCMGFSLVFIIAAVDIFEDWFFLRDFQVAVFMISVIIVMIAHILITKDNYEHLRLDDAMYVALVLFICYLLFMVGARVAAHCISADLEYFKLSRANRRRAAKLIKK